jgi:hypothetical protein
MASQLVGTELNCGISNMNGFLEEVEALSTTHFSPESEQTPTN